MVVKIDSDACTGCGLCVDECPTDAISLNDDVASVDEGLCTDCGICVDVCPTDAISI